MRKDIASEAHGTSLSRQGACSQSYSYSTLSCRSHEAPRSRHAMRMDTDAGVRCLHVSFRPTDGATES